MYQTPTAPSLYSSIYSTTRSSGSSNWSSTVSIIPCAVIERPVYSTFMQAQNQGIVSLLQRTDPKQFAQLQQGEAVYIQNYVPAGSSMQPYELNYFPKIPPAPKYYTNLAEHYQNLGLVGCDIHGNVYQPSQFKKFTQDEINNWSKTVQSFGTWNPQMQRFERPLNENEREQLGLHGNQMVLMGFDRNNQLVQANSGEFAKIQIKINGQDQQLHFLVDKVGDTRFLSPQHRKQQSNELFEKVQNGQITITKIADSRDYGRNYLAENVIEIEVAGNSNMHTTSNSQRSLGNYDSQQKVQPQKYHITLGDIGLKDAAKSFLNNFQLGAKRITQLYDQRLEKRPSLNEVQPANLQTSGLTDLERKMIEAGELFLLKNGMAGTSADLEAENRTGDFAHSKYPFEPFILPQGLAALPPEFQATSRRPSATLHGGPFTPQTQRLSGLNNTNGGVTRGGGSMWC